MDPRTCGTALRGLCLAGLASLLSIGCAGAAPEDGITTNPDARADTRSDGALPAEDTRVSPTDTNVEPEDTRVADDTAPRVDSAVTPDTTDAAGLICAIDEWDLDGVESNGCEFKDTVGNHTLATAFAFGDVSECDSSAGSKSHSGSISSDDRLHGSALESGVVGRPQFITAKHKDGLTCLNDPTYQITMSGGIGVYRVSVFRHGDLSELDSKCSPHEVGGGETSASFACTGQDDGELAVIKIEKVSGPREKVSYTLKYHN
ncbi:MAG: hypothetical protein ABI175_02045 [Polyangiales bacterium]